MTVRVSTLFLGRPVKTVIDVPQSSLKYLYIVSGGLLTGLKSVVDVRTL